MITHVAGVRVGHWTNTEARTGCTVAVLPPGTVVSGEVRGGAPATREFALLDPGRLVDHVDAVVITGGSAFGLAAADGVVTALEADDRGFRTGGGVVPIVVAMGLFDLAVGDRTVRPDAEAGRVAYAAASTGAVELGPVGAGTGATVGKWKGPAHTRPGGLCGAVRTHGDLVVASLVAVNAIGSPDGGEAHGAETEDLLAAGWLPDAGAPATPDPFANTTLALVVTNATLTKTQCHVAAQSAHNGFARALVPSHTLYDGDAAVVAATGAVKASVDAVRALVATVVADAIRTLA